MMRTAFACLHCQAQNIISKCLRLPCRMDILRADDGAVIFPETVDTCTIY